MRRFKVGKRYMTVRPEDNDKLLFPREMDYPLILSRDGGIARIELAAYDLVIERPIEVCGNKEIIRNVTKAEGVFFHIVATRPRPEFDEDELSRVRFWGYRNIF